MAKCNYCGTTILFGGKRDGDLRYCNDRCLNVGSSLVLSSHIPQAKVNEEVWKIHQGACPKCGGPGPVDVHTAYKVWSALVVTNWSSNPQISCRPCGNKARIGAAACSLIVGWWGFPWGLIWTPVQIVRNISGLISAPDPAKPSPKLEKSVRIALGSQLAKHAAAQAAKEP